MWKMSYGMTGIVTDIKSLALKEMPIYVVIAAGLAFVVLLFAMDSIVVPVLFLLNSYEDNKKRFPDDDERAMGHAIHYLGRVVFGSALVGCLRK